MFSFKVKPPTDPPQEPTEIDVLIAEARQECDLKEGETQLQVIQ